MTIDEAVARAETQMRQHLAASQQKFRSDMLDAGAAESELEQLIQDASTEQETWLRETFLPNVTRELQAMHLVDVIAREVRPGLEQAAHLIRECARLELEIPNIISKQDIERLLRELAAGHDEDIRAVLGRVEVHLAVKLNELLRKDSTQ